MNTTYQNYFKDHYGYAFSATDLQKYRQWFFAQWQEISTRVALSKTDSVLEIGSGVGGFYSFVSERKPKKYLGIELDHQAARFARRYFGAHLFEHISIEDLPTTTTYSRIYSFEVLEHVIDPTLVLKKIRSLLKKNGIFCGTSPYPFLKNVLADETHRYVLHPKTWEKLCIEAGFTQVTVLPMSFLPYLWRMNRHLNPLFHFYIPFRYCVSTSLIIAKA